MFDGAHNKQKITALVSVLHDRYRDTPIGVVFASSKQNPEKQIDMLGEVAKTVLLTRYDFSELDMLKSPTDLEKFANDSDIIYVPNAKDVASYIKSSDIDTWVITGSFRVLLEMKKALI